MADVNGADDRLRAARAAKERFGPQLIANPDVHGVGVGRRRVDGRLTDEYAVVCIGPAGEAGVAYSTIVAEGVYMAEPAGPGAVMARKQVKAIAIRGSAAIAPLRCRPGPPVTPDIASTEAAVPTRTVTRT